MLSAMWDVRWLREARLEREGLPVTEHVALDRAVEELAIFGPQLPFPHQSNLWGSGGLRELRPRGGRSAWRALYQRRNEFFLIAAISPDASADPGGFARAMADALRRLREVESE